MEKFEWQLLLRTCVNCDKIIYIWYKRVGFGMNEVLRQEKKFSINVMDGAKLRKLLDRVMISDEHNGVQGYTIRSLYFDTCDFVIYKGTHKLINRKKFEDYINNIKVL